ncbi:MAG TPA: hypothetical protein VIM99_13995 [Blastocatellia bacterium]
MNRMNRKMDSLIMALFTLVLSGAVMAQTPKTETYTTRRGGVVTRTVVSDGNGRYQVDTRATGAGGKTVTKSATYDANASDGRIGRGKVLTGPQGRTREVNASATNNGDGSYTHNRDFKGFGGRTASRTTTIGNRGYSVSGRTRSGATYGRSRRR